ncbi:MAG: peptidoglycan-binding protein, partial [Roseimicrobium sp.]
RDRYRGDRDDHRGHDHGDPRYRSYVSSPRSSFVITFGSGYAGQGYYYGPPNSSYYYQTPGVTYYRSRDAVPRQYYPRDWGQQQAGSSTDASVQRALARRGYYNGPIDGSLGSGSRNAIARYQRDRGLPVTGSVTSSLLRSLGI